MDWVKWTGEQKGFVDGRWNKYQDEAKQEYICLELALPSSKLHQTIAY